MAKMRGGRGGKGSHSEQLMDVREAKYTVCIGMVRRRVLYRMHGKTARIVRMHDKTARIVPRARLLALLMTAGV